jgi:hypothetical protein
MTCDPRHNARMMRRMATEQDRRDWQRQMWAAAVTGAVNGAVKGARGVPADAQVRIGDVERENALTALGEHFAAGRLSKEEFDERSSAAWSARTAADLAPLFSDLPSLTPAPPARSRRPAQRQAWRVGFGLWWVFVFLMLLAMAGQVPWFAVAIFAGLWWTGLFAGLHRWVHHRH